MTLFGDLGTLESAGLIRVAQVEPDLEYLFRHTLVQDAAYTSLLESDRKRLHLAVGEAIEGLYPDRKQELAAILGHHFQKAGEDSHAMQYFIIAAEAALAAFANQEAEIQYRRALELVCCSEAEQAELLYGLAEALYRQGRLDEALQTLHEGIELYKNLGDSDGIARMYARAGRVVWHAGDRPEGLRICLEGLEQVQNAANSRGKATLVHETARAYYFNGMSDKALPLCREALGLAEQLGAVDIQADTLATLGILSGLSAEESLEALRKAVELSESTGLLEVAGRAHHNLASMTRRWLADNMMARLHFRRAVELGRLRGVASEELISLMGDMGISMDQGNLKEVEEQLPYLEQLVGKISNPAASLNSIQMVKAALIWFHGDWVESIRMCRQGLEEACQRGDVENQLNLTSELSWVLLEKNRWGELEDLSEVEALVSNALRIVDQGGSDENIEVYCRMSTLRSRQRRLVEARQWLEKARSAAAPKPTAWDDLALDTCEAEIASSEGRWAEALLFAESVAVGEARLERRFNWARALLEWAELHIRRNEPADLEQAQTLLREALTVFEEMGAQRYRELVLEKLQAVRTETYAQALDHEKLTRELRRTRRVQESLLPEKPPQIPGWDLAIAFDPAHETSGDFYDFIPLPDGKWGLVIADVTDKGTSAALFMALSRSLLRTFATQYAAEPERALAETNRRILADSHGGLFVTLFYGVLDPAAGTLRYCNAGHNPACLFRVLAGEVVELRRTGIPLGVFDETDWKQETTIIKPGDTLVLYTDGVTEAQNAQMQSFGEEQLLASARAHLGKSAGKLRDALLEDIHKFVGDAPKSDDITLMVIVRG